jgi:hypothetical protein
MVNGKWEIGIRDSFAPTFMWGIKNGIERERSFKFVSFPFHYLSILH